MKTLRIIMAGCVPFGFAAGCGDSTPAGEAARGEEATGDYEGITGAPEDTLPRTQILRIDSVPPAGGQQPPR